MKKSKLFIGTLSISTLAFPLVALSCGKQEEMKPEKGTTEAKPSDSGKTQETPAPSTPGTTDQTQAAIKAVLVGPQDVAMQDGFSLDESLTLDVDNAIVTILDENWVNNLATDKKNSKKFIQYSYSSKSFHGKWERSQKWYQGTKLFQIKGIDDINQAISADDVFYTNNKTNKTITSSRMYANIEGNKYTFKFRLYNHKEKKISKNVYSFTVEAK
ncbi:variable surface lipoprotein [Mycoplasma tauri]|uniref:variable surface lipoprotein n=1 Tax=Mycoplasma tauri TaxID=547987 RepID=UPI0019678F07|nr:variable surface lipoprotein [Mycoplasma tauri]QSB07244.1 variable surface lipoprotein [Mycoplasma tauri]